MVRRIPTARGHEPPPCMPVSAGQEVNARQRRFARGRIGVWVLR